MKNIALLCSVLIAGLTACTKDLNNREAKNVPPAPEFFDIILESGLNKFYATPPNTTWHDVDAFYLDGVEKYRTRPEMDNFKCAAIQCMVDFYQMPDDESDGATERIGYYAQEMAGLKNCNPEVLYSMLIRLKGHWEPSKIMQVASTGYQNALSLFRACWGFSAGAKNEGFLRQFLCF